MNGLDIEGVGIGIVSYRERFPETIEAIKFLKKNYPLKLIVSASVGNKTPGNEFKELGIKGVLAKLDTDPDKLLEAIEEVKNGRQYYPECLMLRDGIFCVINVTN